MLQMSKIQLDPALLVTGTSVYLPSNCSILDIYYNNETAKIDMVILFDSSYMENTIRNFQLFPADKEIPYDDINYVGVVRDSSMKEKYLFEIFSEDFTFYYRRIEFDTPSIFDEIFKIQDRLQILCNTLRGNNIDLKSSSLDKLSKMNDDLDLLVKKYESLVGV